MAYSDVVLADSPLLYWRLDETTPGTGTAADSSGNGRNGTYVGSPTSFSSLVPSTSNTSVDFNGSSQYVTSTYDPFAALATRTFEVWVRRDAITNADCMWAGDVAATQPIFIYQAALNDVLFYTSAGSAAQTWTNVGTVGRVEHFVLTFNGNTKVSELFIDGNSKGTKTHSTDFNVTHGNFKVASRATGVGDPFDGKIDEVAIYGAVLSGDRIRAHYMAGAAVSTVPVRPLMLGLKKMRPVWSPVLTPLPAFTSEVAVAGDVTVVVSAATAVGVATDPVVRVDVPTTAPTAVGVAGTPTVVVKVVPAAGLAVGVTSAPTVVVVVFPTAALAVASSPAPSVQIGLILIVSPAVALGVVPAPVVLVTKAATAGLALGVTSSPTVVVVIPVTAGLAVGSTPAPTVVIAGNVTVVVSAAVALGVVSAPVVLLTKIVTAALAAGVSPNPLVLSRIILNAALAVASAPAPTVLAGVIPPVAGQVALTDASGMVVFIIDTTGPAVSVSNALGADAATTSTPGQDATVVDGSGAAVTVRNVDA